MQIAKIFLFSMIWCAFDVKSTMQVKFYQEIEPKCCTYKVRLVSNYKIDLIDGLKFYNFDDFRAIKFADLNLAKYTYKQIDVYWSFYPTKAIILDRSFDLDEFKNFNSTVFSIEFFLVKGFDVASFHLRFNPFILQLTRLIFYKSEFALYKNQTHHCESNKLLPNQYYFKNINSLQFNYGQKYSRQTCKLLFKNAKIDKVFFYYLADSFIQRNMLGFIPDRSSNISLKSVVKYALFRMYKIKIDANLLDDEVFKFVTSICLNGQIDLIQQDVFRNLVYLNHISLFVSNFRKLLSSGVGWINSIQAANRAVNMSNQTDVLKHLDRVKIIQTFQLSSLFDSKIQQPYLYPDEDFCWYLSVPLNRLVFIDPQMSCVNKRCSCTQYWLIRYVHVLNGSHGSYSLLKRAINVRSSFSFSKYETEIKNCQFERRIKNCATFHAPGTVEEETTFQIALADSQMVDFVNVILIQVASFAGIVVNIVNIVIIGKINLLKTPEEQQQLTLIRFMLAYVVINLAYCIVHSISLVGKCIGLNSIFCSQLYFTQFAQYYKLIFVEYVSVDLKTLSNVVYFIISLNRYILLEKESKIAKYVNDSISQWTKKKKTFCVIFFIILTMTLNVHKILIYKVLEESTGVSKFLYEQNPDMFLSVPFFLFNSNFYQFTFDYTTVDMKRLQNMANSKAVAFEVLTYVNFVLNDVLLFVVFTVFDIYLVIGFQNATDKKTLFYKDKLDDVKVQKQLTEMQQGVKNIQRVIIVNTVALLIVKIFDLFIAVSKFRIWKDDLHDMEYNRKLNSFCYTVNICLVYEELVKTLYMFYYCFSIVSFYNMNKNFRLKLRSIFCIRDT